MTSPQPKPKVRAVIFDCFGVLYDEMLEGFLYRHRAKMTRPLDEIYAEMSHATDTGQKTALQAYAELAEMADITPEQVAREMNDTSSLDQTAMRLIETLRADGYKIGMLSNINAEYFQRFLDHERMRDQFDAIVASSETKFVKPQAGIFKLVLAQLGVKPEEAIFIDDRLRNVEGAAKLGIDAIHYENLSRLKSALMKRGVLKQLPPTNYFAGIGLWGLVGTVAWQAAGPLLLLATGGAYLDRHLHSAPALMLIGVIAAFAVSYVLVRGTVRRLQQRVDSLVAKGDIKP